MAYLLHTIQTLYPTQTYKNEYRYQYELWHELINKDSSCLGLKQRGRPSIVALARDTRIIQTDKLDDVRQPVLCTLSGLKEVVALAKNGFISNELLDKWIVLNLHPYRIGTDPQCMQLWDTFVNYEAKVTDNWDDFGFDLSEYPAVKAYRCKAFWHVRIDWNENCSRKRVKILNKIFAFGSSADKKHTKLDVASLVSHTHQPHLQVGLNRAFSYVRVGLKNLTSLCTLTHSAGNPFATRMFDLWDEYHMCCRDEAEYVLTQKCLSVALRRTTKLPNGEVMPVQAVAAMSYWELATGRSQHVTDWEAEKIKRTTVASHMKLAFDPRPTCPDTNSDFIAELTIVLREVLSPLTKFIKG